MSIELTVNNRRMVINNEIIDRDIELLEEQGKVGGYKDGVYQAPRPNIHGLLTCLRDQRKYDPSQIEGVCMSTCPHNKQVNALADDGCHLEDCWGDMFNATSLDGKNKYVEYPSSL